MHGHDSYGHHTLGHDGVRPVRVTAWVRGRVQEVGFRWWTRARALEIGLTGYAVNLGDGRVQVVAEGLHADCEELLVLLRGPETPGQVSGVTEIWTATGDGYDGFAIR
ncbi:acylphosphatase [Kitasatospora sp. NPDC085879]|jgi:acylphosphatase|uniref:acylphosphatase n=1 Tax=Kitasatospora sp. NPDC085879 TaxID=3154769 RepID=UPI000BB0EEB9|nr:acylphosphatase [Streptomyces sp. TLI_235]PBC77628.1 acylphosphatase [Streptomyces sp. TLI_235]